MPNLLSFFRPKPKCRSNAAQRIQDLFDALSSRVGENAKFEVADSKYGVTIKYQVGILSGVAYIEREVDGFRAKDGKYGIGLKGSVASACYALAVSLNLIDSAI